MGIVSSYFNHVVENVFVDKNVVMYNDYFPDNIDSEEQGSAERTIKSQDIYTGTSIINLEGLDSEVILNNEWSGRTSEHLGQVIVIDSGCPRSLMGEEELEKLSDKIDVQIVKVREENFRFGPSKVYSSRRKAKFLAQIGLNELELEFFIIKGNVPILLGNDTMIPKGGIIDMNENRLVLSEVGLEIPIEMSKGGHFVIPIHSISGEKTKNIQGEEADIVMMLTLGSLKDSNLKAFHDEVGHAVFVATALNEEEKSQVEKVHRYFGHRSSRRVWELFAKANRLKGKKKAVYEVIENCKTCSQFKKAPPRPKIGIPSVNNFNEIVGLDLKVINASKGEYI